MTSFIKPQNLPVKTAVACSKKISFPYPVVSEDGTVLPTYAAALQQENLTFAELVHLTWAMNRTEVHRHLYESYYGPVRSLFERVHGTIVIMHSCSSEPTAVALVRSPGSAVDPPVHLHLEYCLAGDPNNQRLFVECERLKMESNQYLDGIDRENCLGFLYTVCRGLLCLVDCKRERDQEALRKVVERQIDEARRLHSLFARRRAQQVYMHGASTSFGVMVVLLGVSLLLSYRAVPWFEINTAAIAGVFGAFISVISRVSSGTMKCEYQLERRLLLYVGLSRPILGAVFAVVLHMLINGGLVSITVPSGANFRLFQVAVLGFIAGFSERLVRDMLLVTERRMGGLALETEPPTTARPILHNAPGV